jgi:hypothetical protein
MQLYNLQSSVGQYISLCNEMFHSAFADLQTLEDDDEFPLEEGDIKWLNEALAQAE